MNPWHVLLAALLTQVATAAIVQGYPTLAPFLQADLNLSKTQVGLINSTVFLGFTLGAVPGGWLTDRIGSRLVLVGGTLGTGLLAVVIGLAGGGLALLAPLLVVLGLIASTSTPAGAQAVARAFPPRRRGFAMSLRQTGVPLGGALAAAVLPAVAALAHWRAASLVAGVVAFAAAFAALGLYRKRLRPLGSEPPAPVPEARPPGRLLKRDLVLASVAGTTLPVGQFIMIAYLILFLRDVLGVPTLQGAALLSAAQLVGAGSRVVWSAASDRLGGRRKPLLLVVVGLAAFCALLFSRLSSETPLPLVAGLVLLYSAAALGWQGLYFTMLTELADPGWEGRAVGLAILFTSLGILAGPPLFGLLVDLSGSYRLGWLFLAGVLTTGVLLLSLVRERG